MRGKEGEILLSTFVENPLFVRLEEPIIAHAEACNVPKRYLSFLLVFALEQLSHRYTVVLHSMIFFDISSVIEILIHWDKECRRRAFSLKENKLVERLGQQLGNYRLIQYLGAGGFAEVYLGKHRFLNTLAAIKLLHAQLSEREMEQFCEEARTIAHLDHPNIIRVLDFGVEGKTAFLVMAYAPNGTLQQKHSRGELVDLPTVISYVKQIAQALQYAHDQRLIHRDVKPGNMLIGQRGEVLLSDFGVAMAAHTSIYQGQQTMAGTIAYMAPEQIQARPHRASDQYALGVVVYQWLCGELPFHGTFFEVAAQHCQALPPPVREKLTTIPPAVEEVVMRALVKDPQQRFGSVLAFATALEQASQSSQSSRVIPPLIPLHSRSFLLLQGHMASHGVQF